jgi:hypothetical protein
VTTSTRIVLPLNDNGSGSLVGTDLEISADLQVVAYKKERAVGEISQLFRIGFTTSGSLKTYRADRGSNLTAVA